MCPQEKITFSEKTRDFASSQSFRDPSEWTQNSPKADSRSLEGDLFNLHQHFISVLGLEIPPGTCHLNN